MHMYRFGLATIWVFCLLLLTYPELVCHCFFVNEKTFLKNFMEVMRQDYSVIVNFGLIGMVFLDNLADPVFMKKDRQFIRRYDGLGLSCIIVLLFFTFVCNQSGVKELKYSWIPLVLFGIYIVLLLLYKALSYSKENKVCKDIV